jgi:hypothetical protein
MQNKTDPVQRADELRPCIIYTIVHTSVDIDRASFPPADGKVSFTDLMAARAELYRLVAAEKSTMEIPFVETEYREEYGEDYWEGYRDGYAAGWFTRFEIIASPLVLKRNDKEVSTYGCQKAAMRTLSAQDILP